MPRHSLDDALAQLVAPMIFRHRMPPDAEYTFKHPLVHGKRSNEALVNCNTTSKTTSFPSAADGRYRSASRSPPGQSTPRTGSVAPHRPTRTSAACSYRLKSKRRRTRVALRLSARKKQKKHRALQQLVIGGVRVMNVSS